MVLQAGRFAVFVTALWVGGCSDVPGTEPVVAGSPGGASGGGGSTGVAGSAGQSASGAGGAGGAASGVAGAAAGGAMACSSYADDASWSLVVQIKNEMSQTLYLGQETSTCDAQPLFEVEDGARTPLPSLQACRSSCQAMMETGPVACPSVCATPSTVTLEPGQTVSVPWDGRFGVDSALPQQCMAPGQVGPSACVRAERVEAAPYTFIARAGTRRQCLDPSGSCTCMPSAIGGCMTAGTVIAGTIITTELFLKLEPGETTTGGESPLIGLIFKDQ